MFALILQTQSLCVNYQLMKVGDDFASSSATLPFSGQKEKQKYWEKLKIILILINYLL